MNPDTNKVTTSSEIEKSEALIIAENIEYIPDSVISKSTIK